MQILHSLARTCFRISRALTHACLLLLVFLDPVVGASNQIPAVPVPAQGLEHCPRPPQSPAVPDQPVSAELSAALEAAFAKAAARSSATAKGLSVAVLVPGMGCWTAQRGVDGHGNSITSATRFHGASAGKLLTAALIAQAAANGKLDLAAPLHSVLPKLPGPWRAIPVGSLLNHTSGLGTFDENPKYDRFTAAPPAGLITLTPPRLLYPCGTAHRYSNTGYILLGLALERSVGSPWNTQVETNFFAKITNCTALTVDACESHDFAVGHIAGEPLPFLADYRNVSSCGGVVCTALDLARLYEAILQARAVTDAATDLLYQAMVRVQDSAISVWAGRGINRVDTPSGAYLQHRGGIPGFISLAGISLKTGVTVAVMSNDSTIVADDYFFALCIAAARVLGEAPSATAQPAAPAGSSTSAPGSAGNAQSNR